MESEPGLASPLANTAQRKCTADEQDLGFHRALLVRLNGAKVNSRLGFVVVLRLVA
jgi:hypothetical protein